jgi:hypothetical protein
LKFNPGLGYGAALTMIQKSFRSCVTQIPVWWLFFAFSMVVFCVGKAHPSSKTSQPFSEPTYCHPNKFDESEFSLGAYEEMQRKGLVRAHAFKLGKVTLVGAGVGNSKSQALIDLAEQFAPQAKKKRYCTWYLNHPKLDKPDQSTRIQASKTFIHRDIEKSPVLLNEQEAVEQFSRILEKSFDEGESSFLSCAKEENYIALGCNEMMHRGPTVFGMLLAFSGCSPEHALEITNQVWGLNGVKRKVRLAIIKKAYSWGEMKQESRKKLAALFSQN